MNELDDTWSQMLRTAIEKARSTGRDEVADYLELKATNDTVRTIGTQWLMESMIEIAAAQENESLGVAIEKTAPHRFDHLSAKLVGARLTLRHGVRCLSLEAGWTRTPADGFMRGGALAVAKLSHFGMPKHNEVLYLSSPEGVPVWKIVKPLGEPKMATTADLRRHFSLFLG